MSDWIDYGIYVAFLASYLVLLPRQMPMWNRMFLADRNSAWLAAHPDAPTRYSGSPTFMWVSRAIGAVAITVLTAFQLGLLPAPASRSNGQAPLDWQVLWDITSNACVAGTVWFVGGGVLFGLRCANKVPLAEQRRATLEPRSTNDAVPLPLRVATYVAVVATIAAWLVVGALHWYSSPQFWARVAIMLLLAAFFFGLTQAVVHRRPNGFDAAFGPVIRRFEVRTGFALQWMTPVIGAVRLYEEVANAIALDASRALQLAIAGLLAWGFLHWLAWPPKPQGPNRLANDAPPAPSDRAQQT